MWFDGRLISQLTIDDIQRLVDENAEEDEGIEFKVEPYGGPTPSDDKKLELCRDVAAFANADGGYIIIGIRDENDRAAEICPIREPKPHVERLYKTCLDGIEPRIPGLDMQPLGVSTDGSVIVIRVPTSSAQPHMVKVKHSTHFCRRYKDGKREMSYSDIQNSFTSDLTQHRLSEIMERLNSLATRIANEQHQPISADSSILLAQTAEEVQQIMEARLRKETDE